VEINLKKQLINKYNFVNIASPQGQRVFVVKSFITKAYFFVINQPLWRPFKSPLVDTDTRLTNTLVLIFRSLEITILISDKLWYH
jgi:hypothetical protein